MSYNSPAGATPRHADYYYEDKYASPSPTPSPRGASYYYTGGQTPQRPATRAHFRGNSSGAFDYGSPRTPQFSPRYTSEGLYATATANTTASARQPFVDRDPLGYNTPRSGYDPVPERRPSVVHRHGRRNSTSVPQRPQTARPAAAAPKKPPPPARRATEADARKHRIPEGYSLKNWDPTEEPIMLLGSVFDANSLGKWIYDWTVFSFKTGDHPICDQAGELWMLLIQLAGKMRRADEISPLIRSEENKDIVEDFIASGERLTDKLRRLLKACEAPMLKSAKKAKDNQLGLNAGVEFVNTLWGRDRELEKTERFMASVRLWNLRFDANCEEVLLNPSM